MSPACSWRQKVHRAGLFAASLNKEEGKYVNGQLNVRETTDLFAAGLDKEKRVTNTTGHLMRIYTLQGIHLLRVGTALLPIGSISKLTILSLTPVITGCKDNCLLKIQSVYCTSD